VITGATFKDEQKQVGFARVDGEILPMVQYETKGAQRLASSDRAIAGKSPDIKATLNRAALTAAPPPKTFFDIFNPQVVRGKTPYRTEIKPLPKGPLETFPELKTFTKEDLGFDMTNARMKEVQILNHDDKKGVETYIVRAAHDNDGRFMVHQDAFKDNDHFASAVDSRKKAGRPAPQDVERVPVNEMSYQGFKAVAGDKSSNMQVQFLMNIQNPGFWRILQESYKERGISVNTKATWTRAEHGKMFDRLAGSDNANGKILALENHHGALGDKRLTKIITVPAGVTGSEGKLTGALIFEK